MATKNIIRVSEFEKLYYDEAKPFKKKHWEALCRYLEYVNKKEGKRIDYYRLLNKGIQFNNFVGVIQAGSLTIEVLPKIDRDATTAANEIIARRKDDEVIKQMKWHGALLQMLKDCRMLQVNHVDYAALNLRSNSILDIYLELFLSETEALLHDGLSKKYRKQEGNQKSLKGQLQFSKHLAINITHQELFYVQYTEYNRDNIYNQLLLKTLQLVPKLSTSSYLLDKAGRLLLNFPETSSITVNVDSFNRLTFTRKTERYKEALLIAKMLLLNYRPDITGGTEKVLAILFDMNRLWEEWVFRQLKKEESALGISVHRQQTADFWISSLLSRAKSIRPDILIKKGDSIIIIDTKWKIVDNLIPSDEDLKQMYVYNLFWDCYKSILLYPAGKGQSNIGDYIDFRDKNKLFMKCMVRTVNIFDEKSQLDRNFGRTLLEILLGI